MIIALFAYLLQHWQTFQITLSALVLILTPLVVLILPESPRWLVATNKTEKAMAIFRYGAKLNKSTFYSKKNILDENANHQRNHSEHEKPNENLLGLKSFFTQKVLMKNIIIICINCLVATLCYYGITFNSVNFGGLDIYLSFALSGLTEIVGVVFIVFFLDHLGRRTILIGGQLLTGVMCIAANFLQEESDNGALVCTLIGNSCEYVKHFSFYLYLQYSIALSNFIL